jgi:hypothetical protein
VASLGEGAGADHPESQLPAHGLWLTLGALLRHQEPAARG